MITDTHQSSNPAAKNARPLSRNQLYLNPKYTGLAFGATGFVFYLGCMLTMATVSHEKSVFFFNSLLHGFDVGPILKTSVAFPQVALGLMTTFILCWLAGVLIAGFYNLGVHRGHH